MKNKKLITLGLVGILILNSGCVKHKVEEANMQEPSVAVEEVVEVVEETTEEIEVEVAEEIDLQVVKPNELGQIMVIMYHSLGEKNADYVRTVESFRSDMELLYSNGYRPISMEDYIMNHIDIEAGLSPFVLTFDDGHVTNFNIFEETHEIDPNSAVGILLDLHEKHPDFNLKGVFYLNGGYPFKQKELVSYKLNYLLDHGFEIGNHSYGHENFKQTSKAKIEESLGRNQKNLLSIVPEAEIKSLALPFGSRPSNEIDNEVLIKGQYEDTPYEYTSILNVGWRPEYPSIHSKFNPYSINRVRAGDGEFEMIYWMEDLNNNPSKRYISDGDPNIVTILESNVENINMDKIGDLEIRTYTLRDLEGEE